MISSNTTRGGGILAIKDESRDKTNNSEDLEIFVDQKNRERATRAAAARNASARRRFVDPTTCERDYTEAEKEFLEAMQRYKQSSGRVFPTWSEVLEVLISLGYQKVGQDDH
jgi:hypothetical protein